MSERSHYWIYIIECENGTLYTGITTDLDRRWSEHCSGAVKYTRSFRPVRLAASWKLCGSMGEALRVERLIKSQPRIAKVELTSRPGSLRSLVANHLDIDVELKASRRKLHV